MNNILEYKCPCCGGALKFEPSSQKVKCPYCDSEIDVADLLSGCADSSPDPSSLPHDSFDWKYDGEGSDQTSENKNYCSFICNSCGGEIIGDGNTSATECPFCGNPVVISERVSGIFKPDYVIPFKLTLEQAKEKYRQHIAHKFLLPAEFADENRIDAIKGVYIPFWIYDAKVDAYARFDAERVRHWSDAHYMYTSVSTFDVFRSGKMEFSHIPVDGSEKMPNDLMESVEPFDFSEAVPFSSGYLAGFFADKYDMNSDDCAKYANERLRQSTISILKSTVHGYTSVRHHDIDSFKNKLFRMNERSDSYIDPFAGRNVANSGVKTLESSVKYALYPVYLMTTRYKDKSYTFAMNGQTGRFVGDLPLDRRKRNITFASVFAAVTSIALLISYFLR